jgi:salicylate hydroxylase
MGERQPFLIVGGGIGGLTAAIALAAKGLPVRVVERAPQLSEVGAGVQLAPNAGRVLRRLGLEPAITATAVEPAAIDLFDGRTGRRLTTIAGDRFRTGFGIPYRVIHRADLQAALLAAVKRMGIPLQLGAAIESVVPQAGSAVVSIRTPTGSDAVAAEAVIAADGVRSLLRAAIPSSAKAVPTNRTAWRTMLGAGAARQLIPADRVGVWLGPGAHLVHYPVSRGEAINLVAIVEDTFNGDGWNVPGDPRMLAAKFSGWSDRPRQIIDLPSAWQRFAVATIDAERPWLNERLVLLGDAAHAMPPFLAQGAAMAIEDAAVLAEALSAASDTPAALRRYVATRQPRAVAVARASRTAGRRFHMRGAAAVARNLALRLAGSRLILAQHRAIYGWRGPGDAPAASRPA